MVNQLEYKLVVLGGGGVGKSALTIQMITEKFIDDYDPTIEDRYRKTFMINEEPAVLDILDTAGQEEFLSMRDYWIREGEGFLLVYNITNKNTLDEVNALYHHILRTKELSKDTAFKNLPVVLVGNKCDLSKQRQVPYETGAALAKEWGCSFFETSAKTKLNAETCFFELVSSIRDVAKKVDATAKKARKRLNMLKGPQCTLL